MSRIFFATLLGGLVFYVVEKQSIRTGVFEIMHSSKRDSFCFTNDEFANSLITLINGL